MSVPCWPLPDPECCPNWVGVVPALRERMARVAASILWSYTGRQFDQCPKLVRPCGRRCQQRDWALLAPEIIDGVWVNCGSCGCNTGRDCCCDVCEIPLPGPVTEIMMVWWDGEVIDPDTYRVDDYRKLVRTEGECWPMCQDLTARHDEVGAFAISYVRGWPLDDAAMWAYGRYTCELIKSCQGASDCGLPERVQSLTRQGVTVTFEESLRNLNEGRTGLPDVDSWIRAVNPNGLTRPPAVLSPDVKPTRSTTWGMG